MSDVMDYQEAQEASVDEGWVKVSPEMAIILDNLDFEDIGQGAYRASLNPDQIKALTRDQKEQVQSMLAIIGGFYDGKKSYILPSSLSWKDRMDQACSENIVEDVPRAWHQFDTPDELCRRMAGCLNAKPGSLILEPSAGRGKMVEALLEAGYKVFAIEPEDTAYDVLRWKLQDEIKVNRVMLAKADFLDIYKKHGPAGINPLLFAGVVMHPPHMRWSDIKHIQAAYDMLRPGGTMAAIASYSSCFGEEPEALQFADWLADTVDSDEELPLGTFKADYVHGVLLTFVKPAYTE